ncbi:hypothetical protein TKK_0006370 [Trichogramma kaykai]
MFINACHPRGPKVDDISFEIFDKNLSEAAAIIKKSQFNNNQLYSIIAFRNVKDLNFPAINCEDYSSNFEKKNFHEETLQKIEDGIYLNKTEEVDSISFINDEPMENAEENLNALRKQTPWMYCVNAFDELFRNSDVKKYYVRDITSPPTGYTNVLQDIHSLISLDSEDMDQLPGINTPMHYVGMKGSFTPLHEEDGGLSSLNILKMGYKVWLVVDYNYRANLESQFLKLFNKKDKPVCAQIMKHKLYFLTPMKLDEWKIPYTIIRQNPGDLFFIRSGAYHAVINTTLSVAEAVNYGCIQSNSNYEPFVCECIDSHKQNVYQDKTVIGIHTREKKLVGCFKCDENFRTKEFSKFHKDTLRIEQMPG